MPESAVTRTGQRLTGRFPQLRVMYMSGIALIYNVIAHDGTLEEGLSFLQKLLRRPQTLR